jgi:21S rRNA (GM2251-2'-O)-methyltransferase
MQPMLTLALAAVARPLSTAGRPPVARYRGDGSSSSRGGDGGAYGRGGGWSRGGGRGDRSGAAGSNRRSMPQGSRGRDPQPSENPIFNTDFDGPHDDLYGVSPVLAALRSKHRGSFHRLLLQDSLAGDKRKDRPQLQEIEQLAETLDVETMRCDKGTLNNLCKNRPHQGVVLQTSQLTFESLSTMPQPREGTAPLWLALDEVTDPQNFGALLRSALFLGVEGVLVSSKNACPLTPVVSKSSAGAMELMRVHATRNLPRTLEGAASTGWEVVGAALERSVAPSELDSNLPTILVLGSEGHGLRTNVIRACTKLVAIPRAATTEGSIFTGQLDADDALMVDSLNVSVAGGILLYSILAARGRH